VCKKLPFTMHFHLKVFIIILFFCDLFLIYIAQNEDKTSNKNKISATTDHDVDCHDREIGLTTIGDCWSKEVKDDNKFCTFRCMSNSDEKLTYWYDTYTLNEYHLGKCESNYLIDDNNILIIFNHERIFTEWNTFHSINNFIIDINPINIEKIKLMMWNHKIWTFSSIYEKILNLNDKLINIKENICYKHYSFITEYHSTYNPITQFRIKRWGEWRQLLLNKAYNFITPNIMVDPRILIMRNSRERNYINCSFNVKMFEPNEDHISTLTNMIGKSIMIGIHGNGLSNMIFMNENSTIYELIHHKSNLDSLKLFYHNMAHFLNYRYVPLLYRSNDTNLYCDNVIRWWIDNLT
jgi:hypothetical protein